MVVLIEHIPHPLTACVDVLPSLVINANELEEAVADTVYHDDLDMLLVVEHRVIRLQTEFLATLELLEMRFA
jgi:hypothetical protein